MIVQWKKAALSSRAEEKIRQEASLFSIDGYSVPKNKAANALDDWKRTGGIKNSLEKSEKSGRNYPVKILSKTLKSTNYPIDIQNQIHSMALIRLTI